MDLRNSSLTGSKKSLKVLYIPYRIYIIWGILSLVMFLYPLSSNNSESIKYVIAGSCTIGMILSLLELRRRNSRLDLFRLNRSERATILSTSHILIFSVLLTFVFISHNIPLYCYPTWYFSVGLIYKNMYIYAKSDITSIYGNTLVVVAFILFMLILFLGFDYYEDLKISLSLLSSIFVGLGQLFIGIYYLRDAK